MSKYLFTSESVTEGHPDKACDAISDAILDHILSKDPEAHVACETLATKGVVVVSGEVRTNGSTEVEKVVKQTIKDIGYAILKEMEIDTTKFFNLCYDYNYIHSIGINAPSLEGYLFPDTYILLESYTEKDIIELLVNQFNYNYKKFNV